MIAYSIGIAMVTEPNAWEEYAKRSCGLTEERGG